MSDFETIIGSEEWIRAGAYYVRTEGMVKDFAVPLSAEFDSDGSGMQYVVLLDNLLPVATARPVMLDAHTARIGRVCVIPHYRGRNVGRLLIEETERWLKSLGVDKVVIYSRDAVVPFYEKLGYTADWNDTHQGFFTEVYTEKNL
ncbi:MAG: GNAT family N-acetyltransferase [Clostridiales Family XIII bacterium]|jgi:GNAT superfamily N-acetyltransferase|nr:GNAT family N-acetyltransferase [Clostridiales Family XIII bacterium]